MGAEIYPVFKPPVPGAKFDSDGKLLLREHATLDTIARRLHLAPITSFGDNREVPEDFDGDPEELDEVLGEWDEWFLIEDGLKTVNGLINAIRNDRQSAAHFEEPEWILKDLVSLAECLRVALDKNVQFRLEIA